MRILTGDECGLIKEYIPDIAQSKLQKEEAALKSLRKNDIVLPAAYDNIQKVNVRHGMHTIEQDAMMGRHRGVVDMTLLQETIHSDDDHHGNSLQLACLRHNGSVEVWQGHAKPATSNHSRKSKFAHYQRLSLSGDIFEQAKQQSSIVSHVPVKPLALHTLHQHKNSDSNSNSNRLVACDTHGNVAVLKASSDQDDKMSLVSSFAALDNTPNNIHITYTKGKVINTQLVSAMAVSPDTTLSQFAMGGRERDVRLIDLASQQSIWKAKNLPPDPQTLLQQPIWPSAMQFLPHHSNLLAVGTGFGQVRVYDVRSQHSGVQLRRPLQYTSERFLEHRITALCAVGDNELVVGDTTGDLHLLDLRYNLTHANGENHVKKEESAANNGSSLGRFVGPAGSIRQICKHPTLPIIGVVGCDRHLRTYNVHTQKVMDCVYLKQRLTCLVMGAEEGNILQRDEDDVNGYDNIPSEPKDMDQEDVLEDYKDSDEESDRDSDSDNGGDAKEDIDAYEESESDDQDDDNCTKEESASYDENDSNSSSENDAEPAKKRMKNNQESSSGSEESESESDDDDDESESEEEAPKKRRRR